MTVELPSDAIAVQDAQKKYGHTREWYRNNVTIYYAGLPRKSYVSEAEVAKKHEESQRIVIRPPDKDKGDGD